MCFQCRQYRIERCFQLLKAIRFLRRPLIPGRAFDALGNRLGRGNGGYDIWMKAQRAANPKTRFIGIAYECQIVQHIPMEAHDQLMDMVVTARGKLGSGY